MSNQTRYGRTGTGSREIQHKSGRLTQSERLVLIVLADNSTIEGLCSKLPSLRPERIEQAMRRLLELGLAFNASGAGAPANSHEFTPTTISDFLRQTDADPVTVMATPEQVTRTSRMRTLQADSLQAHSTMAQRDDISRRGQQQEPVSLSKVFPGGEAPVFAKEDIDQLRHRADEALQRDTPNNSTTVRTRTLAGIRPGGHSGEGSAKLIIGLLIGASLTAAVIYLF